MEEITLQCEDCQAVCKINHDLIEDRYEVNTCPFCGSKDIYLDTEEEY